MKAEACFHNLIEARLPKSLVDVVDELTNDIWGDTPQFVRRCFRGGMSDGVRGCRDGTWRWRKNAAGNLC